MHFISILIKALPEIKTLLQPVMKRGILLAIHTKLLNNPRTSAALAFIGWDRGLRQHFTAKDSILMSFVENVKYFKSFTPNSILQQYDNRSRPSFSLREAETLNFIMKRNTTFIFQLLMLCKIPRICKLSNGTDCCKSRRLLPLLAVIIPSCSVFSCCLLGMADNKPRLRSLGLLVTSPFTLLCCLSSSCLWCLIFLAPTGALGVTKFSVCETQSVIKQSFVFDNDD